MAKESEDLGSRGKVERDSAEEINPQEREISKRVAAVVSSCLDAAGLAVIQSRFGLVGCDPLSDGWFGYEDGLKVQLKGKGVGEEQEKRACQRAQLEAILGCNHRLPLKSVARTCGIDEHLVESIEADALRKLMGYGRTRRRGG